MTHNGNHLIISKGKCEECYFFSPVGCTKPITSDDFPSCVDDFDEEIIYKTMETINSMSDVFKHMANINPVSMNKPIIRDVTDEVEDMMARRHKWEKDARTCNLCYAEINEGHPGITISYIINGHRSSENMHRACFNENDYINEIINKPNLKIKTFEL